LLVVGNGENSQKPESRNGFHRKGREEEGPDLKPNTVFHREGMRQILVVSEEMSYYGSLLQWSIGQGVIGRGSFGYDISKRPEGYRRSAL
jgi:hypothetical protein